MSTATSPPHVPGWQAAGRVGPPRWLLAATAALTVMTLAMAVAETNWWMHYLIDDGEYVSLAGLAFIALAGIPLYRSGRLFVSLPLIAPWLLFPVITQGNQIIDNLSINWMRLIVHVLLAALFAAPVAVVVLGAVYSARAWRDRLPGRWLAFVPGLRPMAEGRLLEGGAILAASLFVLEIGLAALALGTLMILTLMVMALAALVTSAAAPPSAPSTRAARPRAQRERVALIVLMTGVVASLALFVGFKNRPGAYQGSPSYFMDPARRDEGFRMDLVALSDRPPASPSAPDQVRAAFTAYAVALDELITGYHILDRNYTYHFHNHLFLRYTPLLANYRTVALGHLENALALHATAEAQRALARSTLADDDPLARLLDDVSTYAAFNFERVPVLEQMSAEFERTQAGLQHAAHLYEGEGKVVTVRLSDLLAKHRAVLGSPLVAPVTSEFVTMSRATIARYANRIVGF